MQLAKLRSFRWFWGACTLPVFLVASIIWFSMKTVDIVRQESQQIADVSMPALAALNDLHMALEERNYQLYLYYATTDRQQYLGAITALDPRIQQLMSQLLALGIHHSETLLLKRKLSLLYLHAQRFDAEMYGNRDWDQLRIFLAEENLASETVNAILKRWQSQFRTHADVSSRKALQEAKNLHLIFLSISLAILVLGLFTIIGVFLRMKDRSRLLQMAYYDRLTSLPNRQQAELQLRKQLEQGERGCLLKLKSRRYAMITSGYGHIVGDDLICDASTWLKQALQQNCPNATLYRQSLDSWLVHAPGVVENKAMNSLAKSLLRVNHQPFQSDGRHFNLNCDIGISCYPTDSDSVDVLMRNVDTALQQSSTGGGDFQYFHNGLLAHTELCLQTEQALRDSIQQGSFELHFQPKVDAISAHVVGCEALLRWRKNGQLVSPATFIPLAEETGLVIPIGAWVLNSACVQIRRWLDADLPVVPVAVNISAQHFQQSDFCSQVEQALVSSGVPPALLELEITEGVAADNPQQMLKTMQDLKLMGVSIALDDFGTGYSSLSFLQRFPIDTLKIDRAFVRDMTKSEKNAAIINSLLTLSKSLGYKVVAEGVETLQQHHLLQIKGCDLLQGFLFSKPLPVKDFERLLVLKTLSLPSGA